MDSVAAHDHRSDLMPGRFFPLTRGFIVTSPFGPRSGGFHAGTDFGWGGGSANLPVHAVAGGTVLHAGAASGYGGPDPAGWLVIDHPAEDGGGTSEYGHIIREVGVGQRVEAGQRIGRINPSSVTNGGVAPHLHLSVMPYAYSPNAKIDPVPWLGDARYPGEGNVSGIPNSSGDNDVTQFGIDVSNHQGNFNFAAAKAEGFTFATHKITEADNYRDPFWPRARAEMARHFPDRWGGYVFCRRAADPRREAAVLAAHAGPLDFPLQIDYEDTAGGGSLDDLWARYNAYREVGFTRFLPVYIPRWFWDGRMGRPNLADFPLPVWNSHYVTGTGFAKALYDGKVKDTHPGWAPVGGKEVAILQFTEQAQVAGQRIDANAVRGADTLAAIFGGTPQEDDMSWGEIIKNLNGQDVSREDMVKWIDKNLNELLKQAGPWDQTGGLSNTDALAAIGESLGLPGFKLPDDHPYKQAHPDFGKRA